MSDNHNSIKLNKTSATKGSCERLSFISMKRYYKLSPENNMTKASFFNLTALGSCTLCKISISLLILLSFIVVRPQREVEHKKQQVELETVQNQADSVHVRYFSGT
ncbi:MAG: hypothetical protein PF489_01505 [Salinivirgaceae bacterium]|jgi:hypothetical protein|nr:hypothetical protein [Salinivirgaceae bacterium]